MGTTGSGIKEDRPAHHLDLRSMGGKVNVGIVSISIGVCAEKLILKKDVAQSFNLARTRAFDRR